VCYQEHLKCIICAQNNTLYSLYVEYNDNLVILGKQITNAVQAADEQLNMRVMFILASFFIDQIVKMPHVS